MINSYPNAVRYILSILFLSLVWPAIDLNFLVFFAYVPVLLQMRSMQQQGKATRKFGWWIFSLQLISSAINTLWISNATSLGTIASSLVYAGIFTIPFVLSYKLASAKGNVNNKYGLLILVLAWISIDYLQLYWDLYWPWFHLGNAFANSPNLVQWYEYTGVFGGTLWVWLVNIVVYKLWISWDHASTINQKIWTIFRKGLVYVGLPIACSFWVKGNYELNGLDYKVGIYQPNYHSFGKYDIPLSRQLETFKKSIDSTTYLGLDLYVCPETFIHQHLEEKAMNDHYLIQRIQRYLPDSNTAILTGLNSFRKFLPSELNEPRPTARHYRGNLVEMYNAAFLVDKSHSSKVYHKSKLVAGVEMIPFENFLVPLLGNLSLDFGGEVGSLGRSKYPEIIKHREAKIAPIICFESIFGDYVSAFVQNGANLICIVTNDSWWGDTAGYKQHLAYARLRAIENRRYIVRSANTGISAIIDPFGALNVQSKWDERTLLTGEVKLLEGLTFFVKYKHAIARLSIFVLVLILLHLFVQSKRIV